MKTKTEYDATLFIAAKRAIETAGGAAELSRKITEKKYQVPVSKQAVSVWKRVPVARIHIVSRITGISIEELRPDVFGDPE